MKGKIITENTCPPIPSRNCDWSAYRENWDLGDPYGHGATEQEAIQNLFESEEE